MAAGKRVSVLFVSTAFVAAGLLHFVLTDKLCQIVPPWFRDSRLAVHLSGIAEIAGGVGFAIRRLRRSAAWGLVALLVAVFPANVYMARNRIQLTTEPIPQWLLWSRLPLQAVLIWLVLWSSRTTRADQHSA